MVSMCDDLATGAEVIREDDSEVLYGLGRGPRWYLQKVKSSPPSYHMTSGDSWFGVPAEDAELWIEHPELAP